MTDETLRKESGLEKFGEVWELIETLRQKALIGDVQQTGELFSAINTQLKTEFPGADAKFYIRHLKDAHLDEDARLECTLECREDVEEGRYKLFIASCQRVDYQLTVDIRCRYFDGVKFQEVDE